LGDIIGIEVEFDRPGSVLRAAQKLDALSWPALLREIYLLVV